MGIGLETTDFLNHVRGLGVRFDRTAMIGRQQMYENGNAVGYAEEYFRSLGAVEVTSFDASDYEGAEHVHDFNLPINEKFHGCFSVVFDGGTLEHIFNFPQSIANCMKMLEVGGYFIAVTPTNNYSGHGFYQFSPDLFYQVFCPSNGFSVVAMWVCRAATTERFEVSDHRVANGMAGEILLMVVAKKTADVPLFAEPIQQGAYIKMWRR